MTDFGWRGVVGGATSAEQDETQAKLDILHADLSALVSQSTQALIDAHVFDEAAESFTSPSFDVSDYRKFLLLIDLSVTNAPTDIVIRVQFSDDDTTYHDFMNGPFGDLRYEDTAGDKLEAIFGELCAPYMRAYALSSGCDGTNKFTLTCKVVLSS